MKLVALDKFKIMSQTMLSRIDKRLRQIMTIDELFGGAFEVMFVCPDQFPPVGANSLCADICSKIEHIQVHASSIMSTL